MALDVIMPKLGMYTEDVLLLEWLVAEGATVVRGDVVFMLETEKTTAEVEADGDGFLHRTVEAGAKVSIGGRVGILAASREEYETLSSRAEASAASARSDASDPDPFPGDIAEDGPVATVAENTGEPPASPSMSGDPAPLPRTLASPRALAILARHGVEPDAAAGIAGTGPAGRVIERDVLAYLAGRTGPDLPASSPVAALVDAGAVLERRPLRGRRATIARRMVESLQTAAQLTSVLEIDASRLVSERERHNAAGASPRVSYTAILVSLLATALRRHPLLNSRIAANEIELLAAVNIGVAVDAPDGLIVPVVHAADTLTLDEVNRRLGELVERARTNKLTLRELEGGTFTLSNAGVHPVDITTAILNPPQSALLWVGRIRERAIVIDGGVHVRPTIQACLSFDHRAIDGAPAAEFLGTLDRLIGALDLSNPVTVEPR